MKLAELLFKLNIGICIITETHLRKIEVDQLKFLHYVVISEHCRETEGRIGGGVIIIVHNLFKASRFTLNMPESHPFEMCSARLFPTTSPQSTILITGIYIPPKATKEVTMPLLLNLGRSVKNETADMTFSRVIAGDFNTTSWGDLFEEWSLEMGIWQLNDPGVPTINTLSSIDKILFVPGGYIPSTFLPPDFQESGAHTRGDEILYPATVLPQCAISDHYPIALPIPCDGEESFKTSRRLKLDSLTEMEWEERNETVEEALRSNQETLSNAIRNKNVDHFYNKLEAIIRTAFRGDEITHKPKNQLSPIQQFLRRHSKHPLIGELKKSLDRGDEYYTERLLNQIGADGWKSFLGTVARSNTRSFYAYLAHADGRRTWGFVPADSAPIIHNDEIIIRNRDKCEAIATAFAERMMAAAQRLPGTHHTNPDDYPLEPFQENITETYTPVSEIEITRAIREMKPRKSPGPDGLPTEIFKNTRCLHKAIMRLANLILETGKFPTVLRRVHMVPLIKPGKDPHQVSSRRPISLLCVSVKIIETVLYHRLIHEVEPQLDSAQYAYRRDRGTEMCLTELMDGINRALVRGRYCYLISFDVKGAFDNVSHRQLMKGLKQMKVGVRMRRVIHNWLSKRTFQVKIKTPTGTHLSAVHPITQGLPQGGVLSPLLWLIFFNPVAYRLRNKREGEPIADVEYKDVVFADDITLLITARSLSELRIAAARNVTYIRQILRELSLELSDEKTKNIILSPTLLPDGIFRRSSDLRFQATKKRRVEQHRKVGAIMTRVLDFDPEEDIPMADMNFWEGFPYPAAESMRVLGLTVDMFFSLDEHYQEIINKAQMRQGILSRVARCKWGMDTGVMKMTHDAVITSLLRYALTITGSCIPPDLMRKLNTQIVNIAARKISTLSRSTRIESLHLATGTSTILNLYIKHCAEFLDSCLRARECSTNKRLREELGHYFGVSSFETEDVQILLPKDRITQALRCERLPTIWEQTYWFCRQRKNPQTLQHLEPIPSVYMNNADEINNSLFYRLQTFHFKEATAWIEVALQVLSLAGWNPECSNPQEKNVHQILPPSFTHNHFFPGDVEMDSTKWEDEQEAKEKQKTVATVHTAVAVVDKIGITTCVIFYKGKMEYRGLYVHGRVITKTPPSYLTEAAVLHALRALHGWIQKTKDDDEVRLKGVEVRAGDWITNRAIQNWFITGELTLQSEIATPLAQDIDGLEHWLKVDLRLGPYELWGGVGTGGRLPWRQQQVWQTTEDFRKFAMPELGGGWIETLPLIPITKEETKLLIKEQQDKDEHTAMRMLGELHSESAGIILRLGLTREIIQEALSKLRMKHSAQVNLLSIVCGTRYKYYHQGLLLPTQCPNKHNRVRTCGITDTFDHMLNCYSLRSHLKTGPEAVGFLVMMAKRTQAEGGKRPQPRYIELR